MAGLSGVMDDPLTQLMRVAVRIGAHPDFRGEVEMITASVLVLEAVRLGVAKLEGLPLRPEPEALSPCATVVDLMAHRATHERRSRP